MPPASEQMEEYFSSLQKELDKAYTIANDARKMGIDPEDKVDIPLAANMAERVAGLISSVAPDLLDSNMTLRIKELEKEYGQLDWRVALRVGLEVAQEKFCKFESKKEAMEVGIRVGFSYLTLGIVSAPLEGFINLEIKKRKDGKEYFAVHYAGPIRGAGGTASATSVILADYIRVQMGYYPYDPTEEEVKRYITEIGDYHSRITNLQYFPTEAELEFLLSKIPVEVTGDPTEKIDVSNHKDLPRVHTNKIRGGMCLVVAEGISQKGPKLWKRLSKWGKDFGLDWEFLSDFLEMQKKIKAGGSKKKESSEKLPPNYTFIKDMVAGRPVLGHPLRDGGFRLRYGRARTTGHSATAIHPDTMAVLDNFIAIGTQLKLERPGKACAITVCDSIDGPIVKLKDGSVVRGAGGKDVEEVLFIGDMLICYGDFSENGHKLVPAGYCEEWWALELERCKDKCSIKGERMDELLNTPLINKPTLEEALKICEETGVAMHPAYTYFWKSTSNEHFLSLLKNLKNAKMTESKGVIKKIVLPIEEKAKRCLELIGIPHKVVSNEYVVIEKDDAYAFALTVGLKGNLAKEGSPFESVCESSPFKLKDKGGTFIGSRMGRPEKAKMRKLTGSPQVLFPVGDEGERLRSFQSAMQNKKVTADVPLLFCEDCKEYSMYRMCENCGKRAVQKYYCRVCGELSESKCVHGDALKHKRTEIDIQKLFGRALKKLDMKVYPDLIKGVRGTSNKDHFVEYLGKGILRAKHGIYVNKDGTTRYDMSELPITHFKPVEIGTSISKLREMGYVTDTYGNDLVHKNQVCELRPQDIIIPCNQNSLDDSAKKVLTNVAGFIDDLLVKVYDKESYYNAKTGDDLIGHLVIGLAPHISAGMIGRIIGYSQTQGCYSHPLWHAGLRRDCDGDECCVMLLMDAFLNFSRQFLPDKRGGRSMDAPLVLTSRLDPAEVDDQAHGLDIVWKYPLELYEAALEYKNPWDVPIDQIGKFLGDPRQNEGMGFTHNITNINAGVVCSAYKILPSMAEKLAGQMKIASKLRAVDEADVARLVIDRHFIRDIKGNLRKYSQQEFRCVACNTKYRRPPMTGRCNVCNGKIIFTITHGSIVKYLEPSMNLIEQFDVPQYLAQSMRIVQNRIESVFGREKEKQVGLSEFM